MKNLDDMTPDELRAFIAEGAEQAKLDSRRESWVQVDALIDAGWRFELPEIVNGHTYETEPWQWYWRAPAKRKGCKGRRYLSTNQAFNAMRKP